MGPIFLGWPIMRKNYVTSTQHGLMHFFSDWALRGIFTPFLGLRPNESSNIVNAVMWPGCNSTSGHLLMVATRLITWYNCTCNELHS